MQLIIVHHLEYSRSHRVVWLLEELGAEYSLRTWRRGRGMRAPAEARSVHPLGRFPMVEIGGRVLVESGAILEALCEQLPGGAALRPGADALVAERYRMFMHYAEGSLMPPLLVGLITGQVRRAPVPFFVRPLLRAVAGSIDRTYTRAELASHAAFLDGELAGRPYVAGDGFTAADVQLSYGAEALLAQRGVPNLAGWLRRMHERPAYQRALAKTGPPLPPGV